MTKLQYIETEGGEWKEISTTLKIREVEEALNIKDESGRTAFSIIKKIEFKALKLPDGRIFEAKKGKYRHEIMRQIFIKLSKKQKGIIELLRREDRIFTRDEILQEVWGGFSVPGNVNTTIDNIKKKAPGLIEGRKGGRKEERGYKLNRIEERKYFFALKNDYNGYGEE